MTSPKRRRAKKGIQVRMDADLSARAERIFASIGVDTPTAIRMFFMKVVVTGGIPFSVQNDTYMSYTPEEMKEIKEAYEESLDPRNLHGPFSSVKDMLKNLHRRSA